MDNNFHLLARVEELENLLTIEKEKSAKAEADKWFYHGMAESESALAISASIELKWTRERIKELETINAKLRTQHANLQRQNLAPAIFK